MSKSIDILKMYSEYKIKESWMYQTNLTVHAANQMHLLKIQAGGIMKSISRKFFSIYIK